LGILSADYYGTQHWIAITFISIAGILAFRRSDITLFIVTFILASGLHGPKIENLRAWSHATNTGTLNGAYTLKGVIIATGSRELLLQQAPNKTGPTLSKQAQFMRHLKPVTCHLHRAWSCS
jgi:hypothetical protein